MNSTTLSNLKNDLTGLLSFELMPYIILTIVGILAGLFGIIYNIYKQ
jgi:hypothetical protein